MSNPINIEISCDGSFIIDDEEIMSAEPIDMKSCGWTGDTLNIIGNNNNNNNSVVMTNIFENGSTSIVRINSDIIEVGGVRYKRESSDNCQKKLFSMKWNSTPFPNPVITGLNLKGGVKQVDVKARIDDDCDISISGTGNILLPGSYEDSSMNVTISGSGTILGADAIVGTNLGNGKVRRLSLIISGSGNVRGFHALKSLKATVSGVGNVSCTHDPQCSVRQQKSGMGIINFTP